MTGVSLLEVWLNVGAKIDNLWSMYIVVNLGLFWFFFLVHRPLLFLERILAVFAYSVFAYINGKALINAYALLEAMRRDLVTKFAQELGAAPDTLSLLTANSYAGRHEIIMITHVGGFVLVMLLFLTRNVMIRRYYRAFPEQKGLQSGLTD